MKTKDLIAMLQQLPEDSEVNLDNGNTGYQHNGITDIFKVNRDEDPDFFEYVKKDISVLYVLRLD